MKVESSKLLNDALQHYSKELQEANLPKVLSSIMSTTGLPIEYAGIGDYILTVRKNLEQEAGGNLTQLQTICLDSICEVLILVKFIGTHIGQTIGESVITYDRSGTPKISDLASKGFGGFQGVLDKKLKLFHELAMKHQMVKKKSGYMESVMGGRPTRGR